jgi:hypothetical protein
MKKLVKLELMPAEQRQPGRPKKILNLAKLEKVRTVVPNTLGETILDLLLFDARQMDANTARELLRFLPQLLQLRRAWRAHFAEHGCLACRRMRTEYGSGGLCATCCHRIGGRMRRWFRNIDASRDVAGEFAVITRKFDAAQQLLNGGDQ